MILMPSKYHGTYPLCLYPVSREITKKNKKKLESIKTCLKLGSGV